MTIVSSPKKVQLYSVVRKNILLLNRYFIRQQQDWRFWITLAILFKMSIFLLQLAQGYPSEIPGFVGATGGDSESYLAPVSNLIENGKYFPDYRMPGYAVIYFPLLLILSKATACNTLIVLQVLIASVAVYSLALASRNIFKSDTLFYLVFFSFLISTYANLFDSFLLTESLCTSAIIISVYFITRYIQCGGWKFLMLSGLFLTWSVFLRPVYAPLFAISGLLLCYHFLKTKKTIKEIIINLLIFIAPFFVAESAWVVRNYQIHKRIVILTPTLYYSEIENSYILELMDFVKSWGGDRTWWNPNAEIRWFGLIESQQNRSRPLENKDIQIPEYIFTSRFTKDSLENVRTIIQKINNPITSATEAQQCNNDIKSKLSRYTQSIIDEKPFLYYVKAPLILIKKFFVHSGTYNLFNKSYEQLSAIELLLKIFYSMVYIVTLVFGLGGVILIVTEKKRGDALRFFVLSLTVYSALIFPIFLRQIEFRYFVPAYPFVLVIACYFLYCLSRYIGIKLQLLKQ